MTNDEKKAELEVSTFTKFFAVANIGVKADTIINGDVKKCEPDIRCEMKEGIVWFELTRAAAPEVARMIGDGLKKGEAAGAWSNDRSEYTVRDKLDNTYKVSEPIELVVYTDGQTVLPRDAIAAKIRYYFTTVRSNIE